MIHTFEEAIQEIFKFEQIRDYSLENMRQAMKLLENPLKDIKVIHIAGTNGKGSVSQMMFSILRSAWKSVWIYSQPHIHDIRERFRTDEWLILKADFIDITNTILRLWIELSYFEKTTLIAFEYFKRSRVEYAIVEVGVWGLLDSTNVVNPCITCITSISLDHQWLLWNTIEEISTQKAWIIKSGVPVVYNIDNQVIHNTAEKLWSQKIYTDKKITTNLLGNHQQKNAGLAYEIATHAWIGEEIIYQWLIQVKHHGRLQFLSQNILIDGAHNEASLKSLKGFVDSQRKKYKGICYCVSLKQGKSSELFLKVFWRDQRYVAIDTNHNILMTVQDMLQEFKSKSVSTETLTVSEIFSRAYKNIETLYVVCGSLYMLPDFLLQNDAIYLALGSNIWSWDINLDTAKKMLWDAWIIVVKESQRYRTKPMYYKDQDDFLNSVIQVYTNISPQELLRTCQEIEISMGRVKEIEKGPRIIDIDILFYKDRYVLEENLIIPHIGITERDFVLKPLLDVSEDFVYQWKKISEHLLLL